MNEQPDWVECFSKTHQQKYWFNSKTGKSVWTDPTVSVVPTVSAQPRILEDSPIVALERDKCAEHCLNILVAENSRYGPMQGNTKTARSCNKDGMRTGMLGIYARVIWSQLLNQVMTIGDVGSDQRDAIFPSSVFRDIAVEKEFIDGGRSQQQAEDILSKLSDALIESSKRLVRLQRESRSSLDSMQIRLTTSNSSSSSSKNVGTKRKHEEDSEVDPSLTYQLTFENSSKSISGTHFKKLLRLYRLHTDKTASVQDPVFLRRAYCVISRYETLSGSTDGYQMAFPDPGFKWLRDKMGVKIECFASPLNCWNQRICSVARDTDQFFGSLGNFFLFEGYTGGVVTEGDEGEPERGGSFEANPPFVESVMNDMAERIEYLLSKYKEYPFSVVVIVPAWTDCKGIDIMCNSVHSRPHRGYKLTLEKKQHDYRPGMQHRTAHESQPSNVDTFVFFLQNDKGAAKWPVTEADAEELKKLLKDTCHGY